MTLLECVREQQDLLKEGIAFVAFYKTGRQWHTTEFQDLDDIEYYDQSQTQEIEEIIATDPNAMLFNGYLNCPDTEFLNQKELYQMIKVFYEEQRSPAQDWLNMVTLKS